MKQQFIIAETDELQRIISDAVNKVVSSLNPSSDTVQNEVFTNRELMDYLDVSRSTLQRWRDEGKLPYRKVQGKILYTRDDIESLLEAAAR